MAQCTLGFIVGQWQKWILQHDPASVARKKRSGFRVSDTPHNPAKPHAPAKPHPNHQRLPVQSMALMLVINPESASLLPGYGITALTAM